MNLKPTEETLLNIPSYEKLCKNTNNSTLDDSDDSNQKNRRQKLLLGKKKKQDLSSVKIKTLAEIRAEKKLREEQEKKLSPARCDNPDSDEISSTNAEVTSTSRSEEMATDDVDFSKKDERGLKRKSDTGEQQAIRKKPKLRRPQIVDSDSTVSSMGEIEVEGKTEKDVLKRKESKESCKLDEMLLLDEDDFECSNVSLQAEEDLLKDIDDLLSE